MVALATENSELVERDLHILLWNIRSIESKSTELEEIMDGNDILVGLESWLKPGSEFKLPGFKIYRKD